MKERKTKKDNNIMKELSSTIIFTQKSNIKFYQENLDDKSVYSFVFLTSIYHDNIEELKEHLKLQFHSESKYNISKEEYLTTKDDIFEKNYTELNLKEENNNIKTHFNSVEDFNKNIFILSFFISLLPSIFQLSFIYAVYIEYLKDEKYLKINMSLNKINYLFLFCLTFKSFIEFYNGKKIVVYGIYNGFMYRTLLKRILSVLMGLVQIIINLILQIFFTQLFIRAKSIIKSIEVFCVFIVVSQFDNWIGEYYIKASEQLRIYSREYFSQICFVNNRQKYNIKFIDIILYIFFIIVVLLSLFQIK